MLKGKTDKEKKEDLKKKTGIIIGSLKMQTEEYSKRLIAELLRDQTKSKIKK